MLKYIDFCINYLSKYRKSLGLAYYFFGTPITYFLRETVGLAPGSQAFTAGLMILSLLMAAPLNLNRMYAPNRTASTLFLSFSFLAFFYLLAYAPNRGWFTNTSTELVYYCIWFGTFLICMTISINEIKDNFAESIFVIAILGCLCLLIALLQNPMFVVGGMRASIEFKVADGKSATGTTANPHIFAKSAYAGLVASIILLRKYKNSIHKIILNGSILFFIVIVGLTQSMQTLIAIGVFFGLYFVFSIKPINIYRFLKKVFGVQGLVFLMICYFAYNRVMQHPTLPGTIINVSTFIASRFDKIITTISGEKVKSNMEIDFSAKGRVETISEAVGIFEDNVKEGRWIKLIFGNGYEHLYVDSPFIEVYHDMGIIGFILFFGLHFYMINLMMKEFRNPKTPVSSFACYFVILVIINQCASGMPYDFARFSFIGFFCRFCMANQPIYFPKLSSTQTNLQ